MAEASGLIGGAYTVDFARPVAGLPQAFAATGQAGGGEFIAFAARRELVARSRALSTLTGASIRNLLTPLAHGQVPRPDGGASYIVVCAAPPGPALASMPRAWTEAELIDKIVKPLAHTLAALQARGVTHRAIRPANVFQPASGGPAVLGPAWAEPPAYGQPSWMEPPASGICHPAGRGEGTIADDVYALGCLVLTLALGRDPIEGLSERELLFRKLEAGSYATLAGRHRLPTGIAEILRGMLADDPDHRPSPGLLTTPGAARARQVADRPVRRAQRPLDINGIGASTARTLAYGLMVEPTGGLAALRGGVVDRWLRRGLGDAALAVRVEEAVRARDAMVATGDDRANPMLIARVVAALDPAAPLVWRDAILWPDGLGAALNEALHSAPERAAALGEVITGQVADHWPKWRGQEADAPIGLQVQQLRRLMAGDRGNSLLRLNYGLNPLAPCASPSLGKAWVMRLADVLPAMEQAAGQQPAGKRLVDEHIAAFVAAQRNEMPSSNIGQLGGSQGADDALAQIRLLARMQASLHPAPLPRICAWATTAAQEAIKSFSARSRRTGLAARITELAAGGHLSPIVALLDDRDARAEDDNGRAAAQARLSEIDAALARLAVAGHELSPQQRRLGQEVAAGFGMLACLCALAFDVLT